MDTLQPQTDRRAVGGFLFYPLIPMPSQVSYKFGLGDFFVVDLMGRRKMDEERYQAELNRLGELLEDYVGQEIEKFAEVIS